MEKLLPQNTLAECGVLGSIIIDPEALVRVVDFLAPEDFYRDAHRELYEAIVALWKRHEPADYLTLCDEMVRRGKLDDIGGASYITSLINQVPTSGNVEYYGHIVERTAILRRLIHAAGQIAAIAYEEGADAAEAAERAEKLIYTIQRRTTRAAFQPLARYIDEAMAGIIALQEHRDRLLGVPTGYADIDNLWAGMQKGDFILLGGRPSSGKTAFLLNLAYNGALPENGGKCSAIFSLEMAGRRLAQRFLAMDTKFNGHDINRGYIEDDQWDALYGSMGRLSELPIWICDLPANPLPAMRAQLRRLFSEGNPPDVAYVDYIQIIGTEDADRRLDEVARISRLSAGCKDMAREFNIPFVVAGQLSRSVENRANKRPIMSDLRGSGTLEQEADIIAMFYNEDYYARLERRPSLAPGIIEVNTIKHRNGPTGDAGLYFAAPLTRYFNFADAMGEGYLTQVMIDEWERQRDEANTASATSAPTWRRSNGRANSRPATRPGGTWGQATPSDDGDEDDREIPD